RPRPDPAITRLIRRTGTGTIPASVRCALRVEEQESCHGLGLDHRARRRSRLARRRHGAGRHRLDHAAQHGPARARSLGHPRARAPVGEFVAEFTRMSIDAYTNALEKPETVFPVFALLNRIRLTSSAAVLAEAEQAVRTMAEQYFAPNLSLAELRALAREGK